MSHFPGAAARGKKKNYGSLTSKQELNNKVQGKLCLKLLSGCHKAPLLAAGSGARPPPADSTYEWERNLPGYWISVNALN